MYYHPYPFYPPIQQFYRHYPQVDVKIFSSSVKSFRLLMQQGSHLLDRLDNPVFARQVMAAAQAGKTAEVDRLIKSIGLRIPVATRFTPSGVIFVLSTLPSGQTLVSCCTLTVSLKWGT
jgi:hypothetical protein